MGNKIAASFLVAVFVIVALLSTASSVVESAAANISTTSDEEIEQFQETIRKGDAAIMNCILIIACLIIGFLVGRIGSNAYDGLIVLDSRTGRAFMKLGLADEAVSRCRFITLKVIKDDEKGEYQ